MFCLRSSFPKPPLLSQSFQTCQGRLNAPGQRPAALLPSTALPPQPGKLPVRMQSVASVLAVPKATALWPALLSLGGVTTVVFHDQPPGGDLGAWIQASWACPSPPAGVCSQASRRLAKGNKSTAHWKARETPETHVLWNDCPVLYPPGPHLKNSGLCEPPPGLRSPCFGWPNSKAHRSPHLRQTQCCAAARSDSAQTRGGRRGTAALRRRRHSNALAGSEGAYRPGSPSRPLLFPPASGCGRAGRRCDKGSAAAPGSNRGSPSLSASGTWTGAEPSGTSARTVR